MYSANESRTCCRPTSFTLGLKAISLYTIVLVAIESFVDAELIRNIM